jgi:hypothetical protein
MAAMSGAWFRRKVRHPWLGGPRRLTMYVATVDCATLNPSLRSSPWMRGAPQSITQSFCPVREACSPVGVGLSQSGNFLQLEGGAARHRAAAETRQHDPSALIAEPSDPGTTDVCPNSIGLDRDHINAVGSHPLVHKIHQVNQPPLVPASTAVPTAATKQQNEKHNDEKRGGIHVRFPRNAACCAA